MLLDRVIIWEFVHRHEPYGGMDSDRFATGPAPIFRLKQFSHRLLKFAILKRNTGVCIPAPVFLIGLHWSESSSAVFFHT
jgi:hypothetical protein